MKFAACDLKPGDKININGKWLEVFDTEFVRYGLVAIKYITGADGDLETITTAYSTQYDVTY